MAEMTCPYAKREGQNGLFYCMKPTEAAPKKAAKGKKKAAEDAQTAPLTCGHQRYCPQRKKCVLTEQAAICPKRKE